MHRRCSEPVSRFAFWSWRVSATARHTLDVDDAADIDLDLDTGHRHPPFEDAGDHPMDARKLAAFRAAAERYTRARTATREIARRTLIDQGIYTEDGQIAPEYGGEMRPGEAEKRRM